jgi:ERCC4-type nuclease
MNNLELVIDQREQKIKKLWTGKVIYETLDVGDFLFRLPASEDKDAEIVLVIERKTASDLAASIRDGRNREQKARLLNSGIPRDRVLYLIEGLTHHQPDVKIGSVTYSTLWGSVINTQLRDGIKVYKTDNINETIQYLEKLFDKLKKDGNDFFKYDEKKEMGAVEYSATLKSQKKANLTPEVWFIRQLSLIPGITDKLAGEIVDIYPCLRRLVLDYEELDEDERPGMLADITYTIPSGKKRRIGNAISARICEYVYGEG